MQIQEIDTNLKLLYVRIVYFLHCQYFNVSHILKLKQLNNHGLLVEHLFFCCCYEPIL